MTCVDTAGVVPWWNSSSGHVVRTSSLLRALSAILSQLCCQSRAVATPPVTRGAGSVLPKNYDLRTFGEVYKLCPLPPPPPPRGAHQKNTRVWNTTTTNANGGQYVRFWRALRCGW
ncbi:unnamed protein product [Ectocarpus sp. 4 AP-2014]